MVPNTIIIRDMCFPQRLEATLLTFLTLTTNQSYFAQENN